MSIYKTVLCSARSALDRGRVLPAQMSIEENEEKKNRGQRDGSHSGETGSAGETEVELEQESPYPHVLGSSHVKPGPRSSSSH